jgi:hypothetical protein
MMDKALILQLLIGLLSVCVMVVLVERCAWLMGLVNKQDWNPLVRSATIVLILAVLAVLLVCLILMFRLAEHLIPQPARFIPLPPLGGVKLSSP